MEYVQRLARLIPNQVLSFIKSFYPTANLAVVASRVASDCTDEKLKELMEQTAPIAEKMESLLKLQ